MTLSLTASNSLGLSSISTLFLPGSEITAFDPGFDRVWVTSGSGLRIVNFANPANPTLAATIDFTQPPYNFSNDVNSVAIKNGIVAIAVNAPVATNPGKVFLFNTDGSFITSVDVGAVPDNLVFTPDGTRILVANEGESNLESVAAPLTTNPEGSITIIDISGGAASPVVQTAGFTAFNGEANALIAEGVRLFVSSPVFAAANGGTGTTVAQDLEPEYIAVSADGTKAFVTLQEANSIAILDIASATVTDIVPMGLKDWSSLPFDGSDRDLGPGFTMGTPSFVTGRPIFGIYQPDAIASFTVGGQTYYITANEGDDRNDFLNPNETTTVGNANYDLDNTLFPNEATLKLNQNLGRLTVSNLVGLRGDTDGDGDIDQIITYGGRSFSILDASGAIIFDSGAHIDTAVAALSPANFADNRSTAKGSEPEGVTTAVLNSRVYAFIGLERFAGTMVYDVTDPLNPVFTTFTSNPAGFAGNSALQRPEGGLYISAEDSPTGRALYLVSNEGTGSGGSLVTYQVDGGGVFGTAGIDTLDGTTFDETINGLAGDDRIDGKAGDDVLIGGAGADTIIGGEGFDTVSYETAEAGIIINLSTGRGSGGDADGDRLSEIEAVLGSDFTDTITGSRTADTLDGGAGDDVLLGARGADTMIGGAGDDVLTGGVDADVFSFEAVDNGSIDIITDFHLGDGDSLLFGDGVTVTAASVGFLTTGATANGVDLRNSAGALDLVLTLESAAGSQTVHILDAYNFASNDYWEGVLGLELTYPRPLPTGTDMLPIA
jgi:Ca2+-binding RTX toxin-like protein